MSETKPEDVLRFWREAGSEKWFKKSDVFDAEIKARFEGALQAASKGEFDHWQDTPDSTIALIILLDQFSRNIYRDDARAFAQDARCLEVVNRAMETGADREMPQDLLSFCYMPLMHSESLEDQERCITEMKRLGDENTVKFAVLHRDIIVDFGRFPHRNKVLNRQTSNEEQAFLDSGGFSG